VTYRDVADPTCAGCGALLEQASTYYDTDGAQVCPRCHKLREMDSARLRAEADDERDANRDNNAYLIARVLVVVGLLVVAGVMSMVSRCGH
jgi:hypothetical protein